MNYLRQKTDVPLPGISVAEFPYLLSPPSGYSAAPQPHETPHAIDPLVSANDDAHHDDDDDDEGPRRWYQIRFHNPLWVIAAAMGFLFSVLAFLVALS